MIFEFPALLFLVNKPNFTTQTYQLNICWKASICSKQLMKMFLELYWKVVSIKFGCRNLELIIHTTFSLVSAISFIYRTRAIITRGLYIFTPVFSVAYNQEWLIFHFFIKAW